jgi:hypothetical protein
VLLGPVFRATFRSTWPVLMTLVLALNACGSSGQSASDGSTDATPTGGAGGLLQPIAEAFCAAARACCPVAGFPAAYLVNCEARYPDIQDATKLVNAGRIHLDAALLPACLAAYQQAARTCQIADIYTACQNLFVGTRGQNEPCSSQFECRGDQGPMTCLFAEAQDGTTPVGTCQKVGRAAVGETCGFTCLVGGVCSSTTYGPPVSPLCHEEEALYCSSMSQPSSCAVIVALGAACTSLNDDPCGPRAYCDGTCQKRRGVGEACDNDTNCTLDLSCVSGLCTLPLFANGLTCQGIAPSP